MSSIFHNITTLLSLIDFTLPPANELLAISGAINGITAAAVGVAIFFGKKKDKNTVSLRFAIFMLAMVVWSLGYYFWLTSDNVYDARFWIGILNVGATFIPILYYHWICTFFKLRRKFVLRLFYGGTIFFVGFSFSNLYFDGFLSIGNFPYWPQAGIIYPYFIIILYGGAFLVSILEIVTILYEHKVIGENTGTVAKIILSGVLLSGISGAMNFMPWFGIKIFPWANFLVVLQIILFTYAVYRYHVVHARQVVASFTVTLIVIVLVIDLINSQSIVDILYRGIVLVIILYFARIMLRIFDEEVTERERAEKLSKQLNIVNERLVRLDKAKSDMLSIAAHQLRTPLTAMKGYLSLVLDGDTGEVIGVKTQEMLTKVSRAITRLGALVNNLLNMSRIDDGRMQYTMRPIHIEEMIRETAETFDILVREKGLRLRIDIPPRPLPLVNVDDNKMHEVISNLINNAIKYTVEGSITVRVWQHDATHLRFSVRDTGVGIPDDVAGKLFSKFSRADKQQLNTEGAGIGLYVCYNIVRDHKGRIWAESDGEGKGSTFIVELDIAQDHSVE